MEKLFLDAFDGEKIPVTFFPCDNPKGLFQIIHGSLEHKQRYYDFCEFLNKNGYAVIISDLRGHGEYVNEKYPRGHFINLDELIDDAVVVTHFIKNKYPGKDLTLFGHSLGSQLARVYLEKHDDEIKNLILTGTVEYEHFAWLGDFMCGVVAFFKGGYTKKSKLLKKC